MLSRKLQILAEARNVGRSVPEESSRYLPEATDSFSGSVVVPWRAASIARDHKIHAMMPRVGGFPPALARYLIARFSSPGNLVLDPFCGKGTSLVEALSLGRDAIGGDIAPDAVIVTRAKCTKASLPDVLHYIGMLDTKSVTSIGAAPPEVRQFFHRDTLKQILSIRKQLLKDMKSASRRDTATFTCGVMLGLLHGHSQLSLSLPCNQCFAMAPQYVERYARRHKLIRPRRDVRACLLSKVESIWPINERPGCASVIEAPAEDCDDYVRQLRRRAHLVVTSPPYLNRQTYIKDSWLRFWFLDRNRHPIVRKSLETGSIEVFVTTMARTLSAISRVVVPGGIICLVCGRSKTPINGHHETVRISDLCLYSLTKLSDAREKLKVLLCIRDRKLMKRGSYFAVHHGLHRNGNGKPSPRYGEEEILILEKK